MDKAGSDAYISYAVNFLDVIALIGMGCDEGLIQLSGSTSDVFESEGTCNDFGRSLQP